MQRSLKLAGVFVGVVLGAMLWFWLVFSHNRVVCGDIVQPLFLAGSTWFVGLAVLWGVVGLLLAAGTGPLLWRGAILSLALGSFFHTFHLGIFNWWMGINLSISALMVIAVTQPLVIYHVYRARLPSRQYRRAAERWAAIAGAGLLGVMGTHLLLLNIPCQIMNPYLDLWTQILAGSVSWYVIWGVIPSLITAMIMVGEAQPARS